MIVLFLFLVPLLGGLVSFFLKNDKAVRTWALLVSLIALSLAIIPLTLSPVSGQLSYSAPWLGSLGSSFSIKLDGLSKLLCLLTAIVYPVIFIATTILAFNFLGDGLRDAADPYSQ